MVGGPACEWVPKDGSMVGGLVVAMGGCEGCGGSVGGGGCVSILFYFFWWLWPQQFFWLWFFFFFFSFL